MRKLIVIVAAAVALSLVGVAAASAAKPDRSRTDGNSLSAWWTQVDGPPAAGQPFGNVHVGWLDAYQTTTGKADAYVYVDDFSCPVGVLPHDGHGHEEKGETCSWLGSRFGEGYGLAMTVDRKLTTGTLRGQVTMTAHGPHGEEGDVVGTPGVDVRWSGSGALSRSSGSWRSTDGWGRYFDRYTQESRQATVTGSIGPMGFDPALSGGQVSKYSSMYQWQPR